MYYIYSDTPSHQEEVHGGDHPAADPTLPQPGVPGLSGGDVRMESAGEARRGKPVYLRDNKGISQQNCYSEFSSAILSHPELANTAFEPPPTY